MTEVETVGWHHRLNGHELEQTPGDGEGQGSLVCCSPWGCKESDTTEQLNNNNFCVSGFPGGSVVKNLPADAEDVGLILGWEDPLEKEMATHSNILAWEIPSTKEPGRLQSMGSFVHGVAKELNTT